MLKISLKRLIAMTLIVAMITTSAGFTIFAESIDDMNTTTKNSIEIFHASPSHIANEEGYSGEHEEEIEDDETTTIKSYEEEVPTTGERNLIDAYDNASSSEISDDMEEKSDELLATESEIILDIDKSSESEIKLYDAMPLFGDTPLFGTVAPDTIWLGTYPQSVTWQSGGSAYNIVEPIKWRKLSHNDTEALYVADKILDNVSYHAAGGAITWAGSGIHTWLNDTTANGFIGKAFTTNQLDNTNGIVLEKTITTTGSVDTNDKAFLLSKDEAQTLFTDNNSRRASGTTYAKTKSNGGPTLEIDHGNSPWWLRSRGTAGENYAVHVRAYGLVGIYEPGCIVSSQTQGARPAIYINLESPLYKTSDNAVTWDLNGGSFANGSTLWSSMNTYFGGQLLPAANNFTPPTGKYFIGMSISTATKSSVNTVIPDDQEGNITLKPLFGDHATDKVISYDFGAGTFADWSLLPGNYTPGTAKALPTKFDLARYITPPADQEFKGFAKSGMTATISEIAASETTDINLVAIYGDRPNITWTMGAGSLAPEVESTYISGVGCTLPSQNKVTPPSGYRFDHWILRRAGATDIDPATSIPATIDVNVEVIAVYNKISPSPAPYYPPSGGGGSSSGGGGGNAIMQNVAITTTYINQKKFIKAIINAEDTAWIYDPITNAFKMNIIVKGQTIPAVDGFYVVNKVIDGSITDTYYFDKDGKMLTGWINTTPDNKWYFLESIKNIREGTMAFSWHKVQNDWYYFDKNGSMLANAITPDGYVIGPDGRWVR